jgi:hypothetical protein
MFKERPRAPSGHQRHFDGTFFDKSRETLSLKPRVVTIEISKDSFLRTRRFFSHPRVLVSFILLILIGGAVALRVPFAKAETALYPHTCLGGWNDPSHASDRPDAGEGDARSYTIQNSASVSDSLAELFCGSFAGDIPDKTTPTAVHVRFSWALGEKPAPIVVTADDVASTSEIFPSSINLIIDAPPGAGSQLLIPIPSGEETSPLEENPPADDSGPLVPVPLILDETPFDIAPPPDPEPQSFLLRIERYASLLLAPHIARAEVLDDAATSTETAKETASTTEAAPDAPSVPIDDSLVEVSYTLDGASWQILGKVKAEDMENASFDIPIASTTEWTDLSKLQVSVKNLSTIDDTHVLYMDGMTLQVDYMHQVAKPKIGIVLSDGATLTKEEASTMKVHPHFDDYTTSIILYIANGDDPETWTYEPETLGFGDFLFSDYFSFASPSGRYQLVEYKNDGQTFSCYGLPPVECIADPHFVSRMDFEVDSGRASSDTLPTSP